jgi:hypothetical protein
MKGTVFVPVDFDNKAKSKIGEQDETIEFKEKFSVVSML